MSNDKDSADDTAPDVEAGGPVAGERLAEARRALQIPVIEIAKELHLDEYKVRALENNDFDVIGAPVFAKGHLRKYAQLVKVDVPDVMSDYYQLERSAGAPPLVTTRPRAPREISLGPWLLGFCILLLMAAAYWWFALREDVSTGSTVSDIAPLPQQSGEFGAVTAPQVDGAAAPSGRDVVDDVVGGNVGENAAESDDALSDIASELNAVSLPEPVAVPTQTADAEPAATLETRISITYLGDCWSEISDAGGRRLFFDLGKEGRTVNLTGEAPFNALFGNVDNVRISVNGASFDVPESSRRGRTARLTINGS